MNPSWNASYVFSRIFGSLSLQPEKMKMSLSCKLPYDSFGMENGTSCKIFDVDHSWWVWHGDFYEWNWELEWGELLKRGLGSWRKGKDPRVANWGMMTQNFTHTGVTSNFHHPGYVQTCWDPIGTIDRTDPLSFLSSCSHCFHMLLTSLEHRFDYRPAVRAHWVQACIQRLTDYRCK